MRLRALAPLAAAAALAGCPLPQPLPDYPPGTITPPRILADKIANPGNAVVLVPANCGVEPVYPLSAVVHDSNNIETIEARWFVNYEPTRELYYMFKQEDLVPPDVDPLELRRTVPPPDPDTGDPRPYLFKPYQHLPPAGTVYGSPGDPYPYPGAGIVRVVELVVSNGFNPTVTAPPGLPYRTPKEAFETQAYRWVFLTVPETSGPCEPTSATCVKCPQ